jgi:RNA polymerase sigma factor (sigma-70 family)
MTRKQERNAHELLSDSAGGDIDAYKELFERYSEKLFSFTYYLTYSKEDAEDITSEAFIKVFEALQGRDLTSFNFQAYLYKTAKNLSLKTIERVKREGLTLDEASELPQMDVSVDPQVAALISEQRGTVKDVTDSLTEEQQTALLLKELENLPYDTIAQVLDSNSNAVGALLSRARLKFREVYRMQHVQTEGMPDACASITPMLSAYMDEEATPEQKQWVEEHLASCPICNANLESMRDASITYRSLIPIIPLATLKVWTKANTALAVTKGVASTSAAITTTASTGIIATIGSSVAYKIAAVVTASLIAAGACLGGYFIVTKVAFAKKEVPSVMGLKEQDAEKKVKAAGLECKVIYVHPDWAKTGNEIVSKQEPGKYTEVDKGSTITVSLEDRDFAKARATAEGQIGTARQKVAEAQSMGIDASDLSTVIQSAQAKHDSAKTVEEMVGETDSATFYANTVINECDARIASYKKIADLKARIVGLYAPKGYYDPNDENSYYHRMGKPNYNEFMADGTVIHYFGLGPPRITYGKYTVTSTDVYIEWTRYEVESIESRAINESEHLAIKDSGSGRPMLGDLEPIDAQYRME